MPKLFSVRTRSNIEIERVVHLAPVIGGPIAYAVPLFYDASGASLHFISSAQSFYDA